jgi:methyl-accepting chemotaxis protein
MAADQARRSIGAIDDISLAITDAVGQQDIASRSIAQNVDDAAARTRQVSSIISAANEFAVQTGDLAGRILRAAQDLSQQAWCCRPMRPDLSGR